MEERYGGEKRSVEMERRDGEEGQRGEMAGADPGIFLTEAQVIN